MSTYPSLDGLLRAPPLVSSADANEGNYPRARFDDGIAYAVKQIGRDRAPDQASTYRHRIGYAGELVTATYLDIPVNRDITPAYVGDDGYDLVKDGYKIEVKTVTDDAAPLRVPLKQLETVDYYVLAQCSNPSELVELIGWTNAPSLAVHGFRRGDGTVELGQKYLNLFEPLFLTPDHIRETQTL